MEGLGFGERRGEEEEREQVEDRAIEEQSIGVCCCYEKGLLSVHGSTGSCDWQ